MFDTAVRERREHTRWAVVSLPTFMRDMVWNRPLGEDALDHKVVLSAHYRHDVARRIWYELEWTGADGERHSVASQDLELLLWRAAEVEMGARRNAKEKPK